MSAICLDFREKSVAMGATWLDLAPHLEVSRS
jgi:hypothetical protein